MKTPSDADKEIAQVLKKLLDRIAIVVFTLGTISTAASLLRLNTIGWSPNVILDLATFAAAVIVVLLRNRIPTKIVAGLLLATVGLNGIGNFFAHGFTAIGGAIVVCVVITVSAFLGARAAATALALFVVGLIAGAVLVVSKIIRPEIDPGEYLLDPQTWVIHILSTILYATASLVAVQTIQQNLKSALNRSAEQARSIKFQNEQLRLITESMRDVLFVQDMQLRVTYVSPSVQTMFGYTVDEILEITLDRLFTPESFKRATETFGYYSSLAHRGEINVPLLEFEYCRKDGSTFWGEFKPTFIFDEKGQPIASQAILRDITERMLAQEERDLLTEELRHSEKMRAIGQLAGGVAHDFNNQLAGIMGFADLIRSETTNKTIRDYAANIVAAGSRSADLTSKLLSFARKGKYLAQLVDMHSIISETVGILGHSINKTITVRTDLLAKQSTVTGDTSQIQSALLNIAINARDAMPNGGTLEFSTWNTDFCHASPPRWGVPETQGPHICVSVSDTGKGISHKVMERMFEPFFTTKDPGQGTGMGLAAVYGTMQSHNGGIDVLSEEGSGTTVHLFFPVAQIAPQPNSSTSKETVHRGSGKVMVIEDEPTVRLVIERMLTGLGYDVIGCQNGLDGVAKFTEMGSFLQLVVLDLGLPGLPGNEVLEHIRETAPDLKVLVSSGYGSDATISQLLANDPYTHFVRKPFTMDELARSLSMLQGKQ